MNEPSFQYRFMSTKSADDVFAQLADPNNWWLGLFGASIEGSSEHPGDLFFFTAGEGLHASRQQLVSLVPGSEIVWSIVESNLSFVADPAEWTGTRICFRIVEQEEGTAVTFTHEGLVPLLECYTSCSDAWRQYLQKLAEQLA